MTLVVMIPNLASENPVFCLYIYIYNISTNVKVNVDKSLFHTRIVFLGVTVIFLFLLILIPLVGSSASNI